ncbi:MAG TPA: SxtJ family membrane protein [Candidatus Rifleibacterium sp.]|nr:SxtJ family membrane protein [Candidatus Rifleibacterium sp.]HPT45179.1 SxtJ family membrane protein [Candidatus Rifleibacterium sp.]
MKNTTITDKELRNFGLLVGAVMLLLALWPWHLQLSTRIGAACAAALLVFPALVRPGLLFWPCRVWSMFGYALGWVNTRLILGLLYFLAIFPIGMLLRMTGRAPLKLKFESGSSTYREQPEESAGNLNEQF